MSFATISPNTLPWDIQFKYNGIYMCSILARLAAATPTPATAAYLAQLATYGNPSATGDGATEAATWVTWLQGAIQYMTINPGSVSGSDITAGNALIAAQIVTDTPPTIPAVAQNLKGMYVVPVCTN